MAPRESLQPQTGSHSSFSFSKPYHVYPSSLSTVHFSCGQHRHLSSDIVAHPNYCLLCLATTLSSAPPSHPYLSLLSCKGIVLKHQSNPISPPAYNPSMASQGFHSGIQAPHPGQPLRALWGLHLPPITQGFSLRTILCSCTCYVICPEKPFLCKCRTTFFC